MFFAHHSPSIYLNIVRPLCYPCKTTEPLCANDLLADCSQSSAAQLSTSADRPKKCSVMMHAILKQSSSSKLALTNFQGCSVRAEPFTHMQAPCAIRQQRPKYAEEKMEGYPFSLLTKAQAFTLTVFDLCFTLILRDH